MSAPHLTRTGQRGATLLMTLVMLMIIGMGSSVLMQSALHTDRAALAARAHQQAQQAAELALRHCERQLLQPDGSLAVQAAPAQGHHWQHWASWHGERPLAGGIPAPGQASPPQCLAERDSLPDGTPLILITARGVSPDHRADGRGRTLAGAVAWQQVLLRVEDGRPEHRAGHGQDPADAGDGALIQVGEGGVQGQLLHPSVEEETAGPSSHCRASADGPANPPANLPSTPGADLPTCTPVVLDRLWRPLLNPPRPEAST